MAGLQMVIAAAAHHPAGGLIAQGTGDELRGRRCDHRIGTLRPGQHGVVAGGDALGAGAHDRLVRQPVDVAGVDDGRDAVVHHRGAAVAACAVVEDGRHPGAVEGARHLRLGQRFVQVGRHGRGRQRDRPRLPVHQVGADRVAPMGVARRRVEVGVVLVEDVIQTRVVDGSVRPSAPDSLWRGEVVDRPVRIAWPVLQQHVRLSRKEQALQPGNKHVDLRHVCIEKAGIDGHSRWPSWFFLPRDPRVDDRFRFLSWLESPFGVRDGCHARLHVVEERARLRNQGSEEGLQDSLHLVVRHDPDACSGQKRVGRRVENSSIRRRLVGHSLVPSFDEHVSYRLPTVWQVLVGVDDDAHDIVFLVGSAELDRDAVEESFDAVMGSHFVKMRNATTPTDVLKNMLVSGAFHEEDLGTHVNVPQCARESRWPPRPQ